MQKTIIHIGPHKTGSSYLQASFRQYRAALRERGIVVPAAFEHPGNASQTVLVAALRDGGDLAGAAETIATIEAEGAKSLLLSAEDLSTLGVEPLQRLRGLLGDSEVVVVYYIRRASDMLFSAWQEDVKHTTVMTFPEYANVHLRNPEVSLIFNLNIRLKAFIEVFGKEAIRIAGYSALRDNGIDLFKHFALRFLDWPNVTPEPEPREMNVAATPEQIELLRSLNVIEKLKNPERPQNLRVKLDAAFPHLDLAFLLGEMEPCRKMLVFSDAFPMIARFHKELRQQFAGNVVPPCPAEFFYRLVRKEIPYVGGDFMLRAGVLEALHEVHGKIAG